jgi:hypothetical protein
MQNRFWIERDVEFSFGDRGIARLAAKLDQSINELLVQFQARDKVSRQRGDRE